MSHEAKECVLGSYAFVGYLNFCATCLASAHFCSLQTRLSKCGEWCKLSTDEPNNLVLSFLRCQRSHMQFQVLIVSSTELKARDDVSQLDPHCRIRGSPSAQSCEHLGAVRR